MQDETRIIYVLGFGASYIKEFMVRPELSLGLVKLSLKCAGQGHWA